MLKCSEELMDYLKNRLVEKKPKSGLSFVFDVTNYCNLRCRGCSVNADYIVSDKVSSENLELSKKDVFKVLDDIYSFSLEKGGERVYLNFGGGEPFIREDFLEILEYAKKRIGNVEIAIDTNGTIATLKDVVHASKYVDVIGFSLDGLRDNHNYWRNPAFDDQGFDKTVELIESFVNSRSRECKVEVTCVPTTDNIKEIPDLILFLDELNVDYFSVHRAIQVGRFRFRGDKIPSSEDYFLMASRIAELMGKVELKFHFHHSLEEIYQAIFLGEKVNRERIRLGKSNVSSSLAIDSKGNLHVDPWFIAEPWADLALGSLREESLSELVGWSNERFRHVVSMFSDESRCLGCKMNCNGGSRIAAASNALGSRNVSRDELRSSLKSIDPACPFSKEEVYEKNGSFK